MAAVMWFQKEAVEEEEVLHGFLPGGCQCLMCRVFHFAATEDKRTDRHGGL